MQQPKKNKKQQAHGRKASLASRLFDTHCHPHDDCTNRGLIARLPVAGLCLIGVRDIDWPVVESLHKQHGPKVRAAFGLHPWFAHRRGSDWLEELEALLRRYPTAIVGEIGLDKAAKAPDTGRCEYEHQVEVFDKQMRLAGRLQRPVSIHCVRAFGPLFEIIQRILKEEGKNALPPSIIMHSYGGTVGMMESLITMKNGIGNRFYFSFSPVINMRAPKTVEVIKSIPQDRLLIETDMNTPTAIVDDITEMCGIVAKARGWTVDEAADITLQNSLRVFTFPHVDAPPLSTFYDSEKATDPLEVELQAEIESLIVNFGDASLSSCKCASDGAHVERTDDEHANQTEQTEEDEDEDDTGGWWSQAPFQ